MNRLLTLTIACSFLLAGCSSNDSEPDTADPCVEDPQAEGCNDEQGDSTGNDSPGTGSTGGDSTGNETVAPNQAPTGSLDADIMNGTAPLQVNFTLNGADPDGDAFSWALSAAIGEAPLVNGTFAGNGSELPTTLSVTFDRSGNASAILALDDGKNVTTYRVNITVLEAALEPTDPCAGGPSPCKVSEDLWAEFWSDGVCHAKGAVGSEELGWVHDRPGPSIPNVGGPPVGDNWPTGTGYISGGGTWLYEESNGVPGLQLGGHSSPVPVIGSGEVAAYADCANPDTLIF